VFRFGCCRRYCYLIEFAKQGYLPVILATS
jgi:hypothetical protein